jgi:hypothetical protein
LDEKKAVVIKLKARKRKMPKSPADKCQFLAQFPSGCTPLIVGQGGGLYSRINLIARDTFNG